uniref:(northern house mosquito) hypothetical protein n=1 Tax=Culex pipiens TaxID=7175 RepID=A0A8D8AH97_CULPI
MSPKFCHTPAGVANVQKWLKRNLNGVQPEIPFRKFRNNFLSGIRSGMNPSSGERFDWVLVCLISLVLYALRYTVKLKNNNVKKKKQLNKTYRTMHLILFLK